jgi:hypothetical protein
VITFTYTNVAPNVRYLALIGIQENGSVHWYYPGDDGSQSIPIRSDVVDEPLGDGIRLEMHHASGWLRITAIFSSNPIAKPTIVQAVQALGIEHPAAAKELSPLSLADSNVLEHSVLIDIVSSE